MRDFVENYYTKHILGKAIYDKVIPVKVEMSKFHETENGILCPSDELVSDCNSYCPAFILSADEVFSSALELTKAREGTIIPY